MDIFSRIAVPVREGRLTGKGCAVLGELGAADYRIENKAGESSLVTSALCRLSERLFSLLDDDKQDGKTVISLSKEDAPKDLKNGDQGYKIEVSDGKIELVGFSDLGLFYAVTSLIQLLAADGNEVSLPGLYICDSPDLKKRGHFVESRYASNLMTLSDWEDVVLDLVEKKQNTLVVSLYGCWQIQYDMLVSEYVYYRFDKYPEIKAPVVSRYWSPKQNKWIDETTYPPMYEQNFFGKLCAFGKKHGVEVVPLFNSYGHNTLIPTVYPECSSKFADGRPTTTGFCTNNDKTYEILFNIYDDIIDNCLIPNGITSFSIGLDEIGYEYYGVNAEHPFEVLPAFCACPKCEGKSPIERYIEHAVKLIKYLKSRGMKTVYIYNDMLCTKDQKENYIPLFLQAVRENDIADVVCLDWWTYTDIAESFAFTAENVKGFPLRNVLKPMNGYYHWNIYRPSVRNSFRMAEIAEETQADGIISYTGWDKSCDRTHALQAQSEWNLSATKSIENATRLYSERLFPGYEEAAVKAFALMDGLNEETPSGISTRKLTERYLSYYFYSYLNEGVEYPQNFPGKAVSKLLDDRAECENLMKKIRTDASAAESFFYEVSLDPACSREMARRFGVECTHFRVIVDEFTALLRMHDLNKKGLDDKAIKEITELCDEKIAERQYLMARVEEIKDSYIIPPYLRNMSIFMQMFRDIKTYLCKTPLDKISLDFTDLRPIASKQFLKLR